MTLYLYRVSDNKIVKEYEGADSSECEAKMVADGDWNDSGLATTYTPTFGGSEGLHY